VRFQHDLATQPPPGFIAATSFRIEPVPWLDDHSGYEDWCLLDGSWAMDPLNGFAVTGPRQPAHDAVAALMEQGQGGLYAHAGGEALQMPQSTIYWMTRPRGIAWQAALDPLRAKYPKINIWRRQMVLGQPRSSPSRCQMTRRSMCRTAGRRAASSACGCRDSG
jgi:hypothetical protein